MKILIACDKFKGSMNANQVCRSIEKGILATYSNAVCVTQPLADGGDGTLQILQNHFKFDNVTLNTIDPLNRKIDARYLSRDKTALIELAEASGITLLHKTELDVLSANSVGTGLLMHHALEQGHQKIMLALGGSCTNDVGLGIAYALGFQFLNTENISIIPCGANLIAIKKIIAPKAIPPFQLTILTDVDNPLYGPNGAAHTFGTQKGANQDEVILLDNGVKHIAELIQKSFGKKINNLKGGGAAGGIAAGLFGLLHNVEIKNGFDFIAEKLVLEEKIKEADYVITGEGKLDATSLNGKIVGKLLEMCKKYEKPLIVVAGSQDLKKEQLDSLGFYVADSILNYAKDLKDAMEHGERYLEEIGTRLRF